jgi:hypothetical protein
MHLTAELVAFTLEYVVLLGSRSHQTSNSHRIYLVDCKWVFKVKPKVSR